MGAMGYGYGSECHLLRWMGRHRMAFDAAIRTVTCPNLEKLLWLDNRFDASKAWADQELVGLEFIDDTEVMKEWKEYWPQSGKAQNWDAVGKLIRSERLTWLLLEAKANLPEIGSSCKATGPDSIRTIKDALMQTASDMGATYNDLWFSKYYQFANRLAVANFLRKADVPAKLVMVYFVSDLTCSDRPAPQSVDEWLPVLEKQKRELSLPDTLPIELKSVFLHVAKKKAWDSKGSLIPI